MVCACVCVCVCVCVCRYRTTNNELKLNSMDYKQAKYVIHNHDGNTDLTCAYYSMETEGWESGNTAITINEQLPKYTHSYHNKQQ